VANLSYID